MNAQEKKIRAIAWDLDGTIIKFNIDFIQARRETIDILKENGVDALKLDMKMSILENVSIAKEEFKDIGVSEAKVNDILTKIDKSIIKIEAEAAKTAKIVDGIPNVLKECQELGLNQTIYTLNTSLNARNSLKNVNLLDYFNLIVGRDDVSNPKPHPDHLNYICDQLNIDRKELLIIGDNPRDIEGANKIDAPSIGILTKRHLKKDFIKTNLIIKQSEIPQKLLNAIRSFL